jgi:proteasome lid subunit RPN8/RPN11
MLAEKFAVENDVQLLGIYHSHPNHPAIPSEHDRVAALPYFSYVILSVKDGSIDHIRSWRLNDVSQFEEENFTPVYLNQTI